MQSMRRSPPKKSPKEKRQKRSRSTRFSRRNRRNRKTPPCRATAPTTTTLTSPASSADYRFTEEEYREAQTILSEGRMHLTRVRADYPGYFTGDEQVLSVTGVYLTRTKRENEVRLVLSESRVLDKSCFVNSCRGTYGSDTDSDYEWDWTAKRLCVHELALALLLSDYLKHNHPGDATDRNAMKLLSRFRRMHPAIGNAEEKVLSTKKISLVPRFRDNVLSLSADFRIGTDKLYIVKDLGDLVQKVDAGESLPLGKTGTLIFRRTPSTSARRNTMISSRPSSTTAQGAQATATPPTGPESRACMTARFPSTGSVWTRSTTSRPDTRPASPPP